MEKQKGSKKSVKRVHGSRDVHVHLKNQEPLSELKRTHLTFIIHTLPFTVKIMPQPRYFKRNSLNTPSKAHILKRLQEGQCITELAIEFRVSKTTIYKVMQADEALPWSSPKTDLKINFANRRARKCLNIGNDEDGPSQDVAGEQDATF